jgi:hypothetical protein
MALTRVPEEVNVWILKSPLVVIVPPVGKEIAVLLTVFDSKASEFVTLIVTALPLVTLL